jgi:hypothetical protein
MGMGLTRGEFWLMFHLGVGIVYTHGFLTGLLAFRLDRWYLKAGYVLMAIAAWVTVVSGTWLVYPGYRAKPSETMGDSADLLNYPQQYLEHDPALVYWHDFGMEWKEHVGWVSPILATAVAYVALRHGYLLVKKGSYVRRAVVAVFVVAFLSAFVAAVLGAFLNKVAPNMFLDL